MKTRNGFVSNSSSSSFVIGLARKPETVEELKALMFPVGTPQGFDDPYHGDRHYLADEIAAQAFKDLAKANAISWPKFIEFAGRLGFEGEPEWPSGCYDLPLEERTPILAAYDAAWGLASAAHVEKTYGHLKGKMKFFKLTYGDHDGPFLTFMEHGDVFRNIFRIQISNH